MTPLIKKLAARKTGTSWRTPLPAKAIKDVDEAHAYNASGQGRIAARTLARALKEAYGLQISDGNIAEQIADRWRSLDAKT